MRSAIASRGACAVCSALLGVAVASVALAASGEAETLLDGRAGAEPPPFADADRAAARARMVREQIAARDVADEAVLDAMRRVPRHRFVPAARRDAAYADRPLPIGHGQTISQPYIVALMTERLELSLGDTVLEVGTGSGYQAAVAAQLADEVVSIEIIEPLAEAAADRLERLGYANVTVLHGDGYYGHSQRAPYDAIVVTAAAQHVPPPLVDQLEPGGRMVIPVARSNWTQHLLVVEKRADGSTRTRNIMPVRFVPLTGDH